MRGKTCPTFQRHPKPSKKESQQKSRLPLISGFRIPLVRCIIAPLHLKHFLPALVSVMPLTFILAETSDWTLVSQRLPAGGHKSIDVGGNNSSVLYAGHKPNLAVWYRGLLRCCHAQGHWERSLCLLWAKRWQSKWKCTFSHLSTARSRPCLSACVLFPVTTERLQIEVNGGKTATLFHYHPANVSIAEIPVMWGKGITWQQKWLESKAVLQALLWKKRCLQRPAERKTNYNRSKTIVPGITTASNISRNKMDLMAPR